MAKYCLKCLMNTAFFFLALCLYHGIVNAHVLHFLFNIYVPLPYILFLLCTFVRRSLLCMLYHIHDLLFTFMENWPQVSNLLIKK